MAVSTHHVLSQALKAASEIDSERKEEGKPVEYSNIQEGMLHLHSAWQDLIAAIRSGKGLPDSAAAPATRLAGASIKFATDLSQIRLIKNAA